MKHVMARRHDPFPFVSHLFVAHPQTTKNSTATTLKFFETLLKGKKTDFPSKE